MTRRGLFASLLALVAAPKRAYAAPVVAEMRAVSRVTGIPLHELRPDLFDAPAEHKPETEAA
jgi:hypothetical protein